MGPSAFGPITRAIVIGDIAKLTTETLQFGLRCVLLDFILPGNLQNVVIWSVQVESRAKNSVLTLSKSAREDSALSTGIFSESEGFWELA